MQQGHFQKLTQEGLSTTSASGMPFGMKSNDRGTLVGMTGTGKSTLARVLLADKRNLIVTDPKHCFETAQDSIIVEKIGEVYQASTDRRVTEKGFAIIYRPSITELNREGMDVLYKWIFERQNTFVYNDELAAMIPGPLNYPLHLRAIHTQGRMRNIGVLEGTQRPSGIPQWVYSETDHWYKFPLQTPDDQDRMGDYMGANVKEPKTYPMETVHASKHTFFYWKTGNVGTPAKPYELDL